MNTQEPWHLPHMGNSPHDGLPAFICPRDRVCCGSHGYCEDCVLPEVLSDRLRPAEELPDTLPGIIWGGYLLFCAVVGVWAWLT